MLEDNLSLLRMEIERRANEYAGARQKLGQKLSATERKHKELEDLTRRLNDEYFEQRRVHDHKIRKLQEEKELLKLKGISLQAQFESALKNKTLENQVTKDLAEKRAKEYAGQFKAKSIKKEETLEIVREQYKKVKGIYNNKLKTLEEAIGLMDDATRKMKRSKQLAIDKEIASNHQARKLLKKLELEVIARAEGLDFPEMLNQDDRESDQEDDTINLDDLETLKSKMKAIDRKLAEA